MASVVNRPNGRREIQFTDAAGKRQTVRLGKLSKRDAESVRARIEHLLTARITKRPLEGDTARWVANLDDVLADRLAKWDSSENGNPHYWATTSTHTLPGAPTLSRGLKSSSTQRSGTWLGFSQLADNLRDITAGDADDRRVFLLRKKMSENTVRKHARIAKQFFSAAVRRKLIESNRLRG